MTVSPIHDYVHLDDQTQPTFKKIIKLITIMIMVMMLFLNSTLLDVKKETYEIYTLHVSNNGQLNIYNNTQRSRKGSPKKRKEKKNV